MELCTIKILQISTFKIIIIIILKMEQFGCFIAVLYTNDADGLVNIVDIDQTDRIRFFSVCSDLSVCLFKILTVSQPQKEGVLKII